MLKSIFITAFLSLAHINLAISGYQLYLAGFNWVGFGMLVSSLPIVVFFDFLMISRSRARTDKNLSPLTLFIFIGLGFVLFGSYINGHFDSQSITLESLVAVGWLVYIYWYSSFGKRSNKILKVGNKLPNLSLVDLNHANFESNSLLGAPSLFLFYRGNWCPLCMAQIKEIATDYQKLADRGVQVVMVSPQSHSKTAKLANRFDLPTLFLQDPDNKAAEYLGIEAKNGLPFGMQVLGYDSDVPMPTVIITDANANIVFTDLTDNYRIRPEPSTFLAVFDQLRT